MMPMRMPGTSLLRRVTVSLILRRTWVRQGYMLPVVSKLKTTSTGGMAMRCPFVTGTENRRLRREWPDYRTAAHGRKEKRRLLVEKDGFGCRGPGACLSCCGGDGLISDGSGGTSPGS